MVLWYRIPHNKWCNDQNHSVKSVRNWSFYGPYFFLAFGLNTEIYSRNLRIQHKYAKIRNRKTPNTDTFYAVNDSVQIHRRKKNQILLSAPYQDLSYPKSLISLLYSPFTRNVNELSHNVSVLMILIGNEFLGVRKRLPEIELHIFLSCE